MESVFSTANAAAQGVTGADAGVARNGEAAGKSDMFITLLVAQIRNQNPLEPKDPSEFVTQLTQLTQTEALQNLVSQNVANAGMLESLQTLSLGAQVGSQVSVRAERIELGETPLQGSFTLGAGTGSAAVVLTAADGSTRRIELGPRSAGTVPFTIDPQALGLPPGGYRIAVDAGKDTASPDVEIVSELTSVKLSATGGVLLNVAHLGEVAPGAITGFNGRPQPTNG